MRFCPQDTPTWTLKSGVALVEKFEGGGRCRDHNNEGEGEVLKDSIRKMGVSDKLFLWYCPCKWNMKKKKKTKALRDFKHTQERCWKKRKRCETLNTLRSVVENDDFAFSSLSTEVL